MHGFDCYSTVIWLVQDKVRLLDDLASARRAARRLPLLALSSPSILLHCWPHICPPPSPARRAARRLPLLTHPLLAPHLPTQHDTTATLDSVPVLCHTLTQ